MKNNIWATLLKIWGKFIKFFIGEKASYIEIVIIINRINVYIAAEVYLYKYSSTVQYEHVNSAICIDKKNNTNNVKSFNENLNN